MRLTATEIAEATGGRVIAGAADAVASGFSIDSRTLSSGNGFAALVAARDGHDFVVDALRAGATVALVERAGDAGREQGGTLVQVPDALAALGALGALARARLPDATVVGITGSAGKTGTKDLLAAALGQTLRVTASPVSFNNEAGVPLTILGAQLDTQVVVAEMGARFAGNIRDLCAIARPNVGVVTNIGMAHAGLLGGASGIAAVKGELLEALPPEGLAILDAADPHTPALAGRTGARVVRIATQARDDAEVWAREMRLDGQLRPSFQLVTPIGAEEVRLEMRGAHQVGNAVMAAAVAVELGVPLADIAYGLGRAEAAPGRMQIASTARGATVLDDTYNASPTSTEAALRALAALSIEGRRFAVLGEMRELGADSDDAHREVGRLAAELGVDVIVVGPGAAPIAEGVRAVGNVEVLVVDDVDTASDAISGRIESGDAVLVKASRAIGLERVVATLVAESVADGAART
jgi:UDP-N-acetylmuramoyl-tripeptide--D-alanyl-D-alanine ligase